MPLEDSPSFDHYEPQFDNESSNLPGRKNFSRFFVFGSLILILLLLIGLRTNLFSSFASSDATGAVFGKTVDLSGAPVSAEMVVVNSDLHAKADMQGNFVIQNVPAGEHIIVIGYEGMGMEIPVVVQEDTGEDLGTIKIATTAVP